METRNGRLASSVALLASLVTIASPTMADDREDELMALEKATWQAWADGNGQRYAEHMADDAVYVGSSGIVTGRDELVAAIDGSKCNMTNLEFDDVILRQPSSDVAILTHTTMLDAECDGEAMPETLYSTTVYVRQEDEWRWTSYQVTTPE